MACRNSEAAACLRTFPTGPNCTAALPCSRTRMPDGGSCYSLVCKMAGKNSRVIVRIREMRP